MIRTEAGLRCTHDAIQNLQLALFGLYQEKAKYFNGYPIMAEGIVGEIFKLRKEIDDLIGLTDYVAEFGVPMTNEEIDALADSAASHPESNGSVLPAGEPAGAFGPP